MYHYVYICIINALISLLSTNYFSHVKINECLLNVTFDTDEVSGISLISVLQKQKTIANKLPQDSKPRVYATAFFFFLIFYGTHFRCISATCCVVVCVKFVQPYSY